MAALRSEGDLEASVMQTSLIVAVAVTVYLGASAVPTLTSLVYAEVMVSERKVSVKATASL
jgi:hypothetical protein